MNQKNSVRGAIAFQTPLHVSSLSSASRFAPSISVSSLSSHPSRPLSVSTTSKFHLRRTTVTAVTLPSDSQRTNNSESSQSSSVIQEISNIEQQNEQTQQKTLENEHPSAHPLRIFSSTSATQHGAIHHVAIGGRIGGLTPMRRPRDDPGFTTEEPSMPSQRRSDIMAPKSTGFWFFVPYLAAASVFLGVSFLARRRFIARQKRLVEEFGEVMAMYGTSPESRRDIAKEYKRKIGPAILRETMFASYLSCLITEKAIVPSTIQDVGFVKRLLKLSDDRAVKAMNTLGEQLKEAPSLLGKLMFLGERIIVEPEKLKKLSLVPLFPYSAETVNDLQRNMLERCYKEYVSDEIDAAEGDVHEPPMAAASVLLIDAREAKRLFDSVVLTRQKRKEREDEEARLAAEAAEVEESIAAEEEEHELDSPARTGEPAKTNAHAYQCTECGYTLFPAAGREFKFYGDDFVCPTCGSPKDKFIDLNAEE